MYAGFRYAPGMPLIHSMDSMAIAYNSRWDTNQLTIVGIDHLDYVTGIGNGQLFTRGVSLFTGLTTEQSFRQ